jgi:hypothetical protein
VRERLVEALKLDLVGPRAAPCLAYEGPPCWIRPSNWYLTGFLIPSGTPAEKRADADEDDDLGGEIPGAAGLAEESNEERKAAKKGFFPSSMGLSFLVPKEAHGITVIANTHRRRLRAPTGSPCPFKRQPREETVVVALTGQQSGAMCLAPAASSSYRRTVGLSQDLARTSSGHTFRLGLS